jgi:N-acetylneuraminic acid mutarotase
MKVKTTLPALVISALFAILSCSTTTESENNAPIISELTANPDSLSYNQTSIILCTASDPDGDNLTYAWTSGSGSITGSGSTVTWLSPDSAGQFLISCEVSDGEGAKDNASVSVRVNEAEVPIIGQWQSTTPLAFGRAAHSSVVHNGFLYVIGGTDGSMQYDLDDVLYTRINGDGTINNWQTTTSFPQGRSNHTSFVYNDHLYMIGGWDPVVRYATINGNGTIGPWDSTTALAEGRLAHATVVNNNYVYVLGGYTEAQQSGLNDVHYAALNPDGSLGVWQTATAFPNSRFDHCSMVHNDIVYVIGGENRSVIFDDVLYAPLNPDGTIGQWNTTTSLPGTNTAHSCFVFDNKLFVAGGNSNEIIYAEINQDGTIGPWETSASAFQNARGNHTNVIDDNYVYIIGGRNEQMYLNDVQFALLTQSD